MLWRLHRVDPSSSIGEALNCTPALLDLWFRRPAPESSPWRTLTWSKIKNLYFFCLTNNQKYNRW